ncbi:MAG: J domain-containing protein [Spirochaetaceae bacterium]|nr:MAG: J domain-containing protein [Spirochaetaceae bacterium]
MTVQTAFRILRLTPSSSQKELVTSYRRMVKRYHPDYNAERKEWSHDAMTKINLAYELVRIHLQNGNGSAGTSNNHATEAPTASQDSSPPHQRFQDDLSEGFSQAPAEDPSFVALFDRAADSVLTGIYTYYQYGLQNVYLRHEGVRRFRYRSAVKRVQDGVHHLQELQQYTTSDLHRTQLNVFTGFSLAFLQSMRIDRYHESGSARADAAAYRHYHSGSTALDQVIRAELFHELDDSPPPGGAAAGLKIGYHDLMAVLVKHSSSDWVAEAVVKLHLLEMFTRVTALRNQK